LSEVAPLPLPGPPLRDGTVALRAWRDDDVSALVAALADGEISRWTRVPHPYGPADAIAWLMAQRAARARGDTLSLAIVAAAEPGRPLGSIGITVLHRDARAEIGYWVARHARGRGLATRALGLLTRHAFSALRIARVELVTLPGNAASQAVARRAGFTREGVMRSYLATRGERFDQTMWSRLPGDPPPSRKTGSHRR
jgi:RimJ/RimL family protein N-acetyltransferase